MDTVSTANEARIGDIATDLDGVTVDSHSGVLDQPARSYIVLPHVPGTGHHAILDVAARQ